MIKDKSKILIVDDEVFNLDILQTDLEGEGFEAVRAEDGLIALAKLKENPDIDIVILDRMMPNMNGMQVIKELKGNPKYRDIPIIMQTAAGQTQQVKEGLEAGVYYYLIKPFDQELLMSIVRRALAEVLIRKEARKYNSLQPQKQGERKKETFEFRTLEEVKGLAYHLASCCPNPEMVVYGLNELMTNAVEHGNLNITYMEKLKLLNTNSWQREVERRLGLNENRDKRGMVTFEDDGKVITITIRDQGKGFNWTHYMDFDPARMISDPHGRGIAVTRATSFPNLEYRGNGSEVVCRISRSQ